MDDFIDPILLDLDRYAIGQPVPRSEDPVLVSGKGRYTDDVNLAGQAYAVIVRSHYAHGVIRGIDTSAAREHAGGARRLYRGGPRSRRDRPAAAAAGHEQSRRHADAEPGAATRWRPARCAMSAIRSPRSSPRPLAQAKDAAEAVVVDIDPLPAVTTAREAAAPGAPQLYDDVPGNVGLDFHYGDSEKVAAAFAERRPCDAARTAQQPHRRQPDGAARRGRGVRRRAPALDTAYRLARASSGSATISPTCFGVGRDKMRVLTGRVGGSFGMKQPTYAEHFCIMHAARQLGRPVKWTDERSGSFVSDTHGRDAEMTAELALDRDGNFLAVRLTGYGNLGATYGAPGPSTRNAVRNTLGVYKTPLIEVSTKCVFTNTTPVGAYRGAGRPEANYYMERLVEAAARRNGHRPGRIAPAQPHSAGGDAVQEPERHDL